MQLRDYRSHFGLTLGVVADAVGLANPSVVSKHERGLQRPEPETIDRYREFTKGAVTETDWQTLAIERKRGLESDAAAPMPAEETQNV